MTGLRAWVGAFLLLFSSVFYCNAQTTTTLPPGVIQHNLDDDGHVRVSLQFAFPMYGRVFTESFMFSNGVVGFMSPQTGFCCAGEPLTLQTNPMFSYSIMPLWTDLINYGNGRFLTEGTTSYQRYMWENISQFGRPDSRNTFGVEIKPSGSIDINYSLVDIVGPVTSGIIGNPALGEFTQIYHGNGLSLNQLQSRYSLTTSSICTTNPLANPECPGYAEALLLQQCSLDPLFNSSCPGYATAYFTQQCSINALYSTECLGYQEAYTAAQCSRNPLYSVNCAGYADAYLQQQCSINPLYNTSCNGYAEAYRLQQCSLNPLYDRSCIGYAEAYLSQQCTLNQLYSTLCPGYQQAYFSQQCTQNPLYDRACPGYGAAYHDQQCRISPLYANTCTGYQEAYYSQQCSINPLYDRGCPNYATAYFNQQCSLSALYAPTCPGYQQAYFNQQCSLNPLYNTGCTGYAIAYFNQQCSLSPLYDKTCPGYTKAYVAQTTLTAQKEEQQSVTVVKVEEINKPLSTVDTMVRSVATTITPVSEPPLPPPLGLKPPEPKSEAAVERLSTVPNVTARLSDNIKNAKSFSDQTKIQGIVLGVMNNAVRMDSYSAVTILDAPFYKSENPYSKIVMPVNRRTLQGLSSDRLHNELVNSQYQRGN